MWLSVWKWATGNRLLAIVLAAALVTVLSGAIDGIGARRAASRYLDLAKGWADAYKRDTSASKVAYEAKIKALTADRDTYRKKYEVARGKMGAPWSPPKNPTEIEERFLKMGYRGRVK